MEQHYDEPVYLISVVAKVLSIHPQTLRHFILKEILTVLNLYCV